MRKGQKLRIVLLLSVFFFGLPQAYSQYFQLEDRYLVIQDLNRLKDDAIPIEIIPPLVSDSIAIFQMPKVVPGTYDVNNYGQFVREFLALSAQGDTLPVKRLGVNSWEIREATELYRIYYWVEDSYDSEDGSSIFAPGGTSNDSAAFVLNQFGYIGYLESYADLEFEVLLRHPSMFYGSTAWEAERTDSLDRLVYPDYFTLHDNPLLYCVPDTASLWIGESKVELSLYSPNRVVSAEKAMQIIEEVLVASANYLGGELPVDKYSILVYCDPDLSGNYSYGALEHHRSTLLYMPEMDDDFLYSAIRDIVAHEFLHIITPLRIHSEEIQYFDFANPKMSRHIWLYEGVTEYNSHLVQIRDSIYTPSQFLEVIRDKFTSNDQYEDIPLTVASKYTLDVYNDFYQNFYDGGALAAMALDLYLIELSQGQMRLMDLLNNLSAVYDADTSFVDEDLFQIMGDLSFPQVTTFMIRHFEAGEPFPFERLLNNVGVRYTEVGSSLGWSLGFEDLSYDLETDRFIVSSEEGIDDFGEDLGLRYLDQIVSINGDTLGLFNFQEVLNKYQVEGFEGKKVEFEIARPKKRGGFRYKTLKATAQQVSYEEFHPLELVEEPSPRQLAWRRFWLNW